MRSLAAIGVLGVLLGPGAAQAQFGPIEALAGRVSDLSFYYGVGGVASGSPSLESNPWGVTSFGVELLFEVARIPGADARRRVAEAGVAEERILERVEVRWSEGQADTIHHYRVVQADPAPSPDEILWTLEVGLGYGQAEGFRLRDPDLVLNAMIRTLPALSLYMTYEPIGAYVGLRTGLIRTEALQVMDPAGNIHRGRGEAFQIGGLAGYFVPLRPTYLFLEAAYLLRTFPSVEWTSPNTLHPGIPRRLDASGWTLSGGIQFPVR